MTPTRNAFTLIELVIALLLAALLTAALLRIVTNLSAETRQLRRERIDRLAAGLLADRLRRDLINARGMSLSTQSLLLSGFVSPDLVPGNVSYERRLVGQTPVLVRRLKDQTEICWIGVGTLSVIGDEDVDGETPSADASGSLPPMPSQLRVSMTDVQGHVLIDEVVIHHAH